MNDDAGDGPKTQEEKRYPPFLDDRQDERPFRFPFVSRSFVPSAFTVMNMLCGYISIVMAGEASFIAACWFIIFAAFFDTIDGFVARVTNGTSDFGVELDSLSDLVSFGAAPAYLVYRFGLEGLPGVAGICISSLLMIGSGLRLARFNISMIGYEKNSFCGLPTPAQALTIVGFVLWMSVEPVLSGEALQRFLAILSTLLALLMVSKVNYDALPKPTLAAFRRQPVQFSIYIAAMSGILLFHAKAFFLAMLLYILVGIFRSLSLFWRRQWQP